MKPMTPAQFKAARKKLGLTQKQMGTFSGSKSTRPERLIQDWESGRNPISGWVEMAVKYLLLKNKK